MLSFYGGFEYFTNTKKIESFTTYRFLKVSHSLLHTENFGYGRNCSGADHYIIELQLFLSLQLRL